MSDRREYRRGFSDENIEFMASLTPFITAISFVFIVIVFPILLRNLAGLPRSFAGVADYSAASLAHTNLEITLDEDGFAAELDADGTLRLGKRDDKGKVRQIIPGGWSWDRQGAGVSAGLCFGGQAGSAGTHCYTLSNRSGVLLRPDGTRFGRIAVVSEPEAPPPVSQEIRDITGQ